MIKALAPWFDFERRLYKKALNSKTWALATPHTEDLPTRSKVTAIANDLLTREGPGVMLGMFIRCLQFVLPLEPSIRHTIGDLILCCPKICEETQEGPLTHPNSLYSLKMKLPDRGDIPSPILVFVDCVMSVLALSQPGLHVLTLRAFRELVPLMNERCLHIILEPIWDKVPLATVGPDDVDEDNILSDDFGDDSSDDGDDDDDDDESDDDDDGKQSKKSKKRKNEAISNAAKSKKKKGGQKKKKEDDDEMPDEDDDDHSVEEPDFMPETGDEATIAGGWLHGEELPEATDKEMAAMDHLLVGALRSRAHERARAKQYMSKIKQFRKNVVNLLREYALHPDLHPRFQIDPVLPAVDIILTERLKLMPPAAEVLMKFTKRLEHNTDYSVAKKYEQVLRKLLMVKAPTPMSRTYIIKGVTPLVEALTTWLLKANHIDEVVYAKSIGKAVAFALRRKKKQRVIDQKFYLFLGKVQFREFAWKLLPHILTIAKTSRSKLQYTHINKFFMMPIIKYKKFLTMTPEGTALLLKALPALLEFARGFKSHRKPDQKPRPAFKDFLASIRNFVAYVRRTTPDFATFRQLSDQWDLLVEDLVPLSTIKKPFFNIWNAIRAVTQDEIIKDSGLKYLCIPPPPTTSEPNTMEVDSIEEAKIEEKDHKDDPEDAEDPEANSESEDEE